MRNTWWGLFRHLADERFQFLNSTVNTVTSLSGLQLLGRHHKSIQGRIQLIGQFKLRRNLLDGPE